MIASLRTLILFIFLGLSAVVQAQISGKITVPSTLYPTLDSAINALNILGVGAGGATVNFTAATNEIAPIGGYLLGSATLNASLSASTPLVINGNGNVITGYTGTSTSVDAIFTIQGADYVTINALNLQDAANNTTPTTKMEWGFVLCKLTSVAPYDGCQHDVIDNCSITLDGTYGNTIGIYAKHSIVNVNTFLPYSGINQTSSNSYNRFTSNVIKGVTRGIILSGIPAKAAYDRANEIGGLAAGSGNTIIVGGASNNCYAVNTIYDSVITVSNNSFSIANTQTNGNIYFYLPSTGSGDITFSHNFMDISSATTNGDIVCYFNNQQHKDAGISLSQLSSSHNYSDNTVTGTLSSGSSGSVFGIYESGGYCLNLIMERNKFRNIDMSNSPGKFYGIYNSSAGATNIQVNENEIYNFSKLGASGNFYGIYIDASASLVGVLKASNNIVRKIKSNYSCYNYYIYGSTIAASTGYRAAKLISTFNVLDSVDLSTAPNSYCYNYLGLYGGDSSFIAYDTIMNVRLANSGISKMYNFFGSGNYATQMYSSRGNYVGHIDGGTGDNQIGNYFGYYCTADSSTIEDISLNSSNAFISTTLGYFSPGDLTNNRFQNWSLKGGANANFTIGNYGSPKVSNNLFKNIKINGLGNFSTSNIGYNSIKLEFDHNIWDSISVDSGILSPAKFFGGINGFSIHDNVMTNMFAADTNAAEFYEVVASNQSVDFYNNILSKVFFPAGSNNSKSVGLNLKGTGLYRVYNNTIKIDSTAPAGNYFGFTGIAYDTLAQLDLRNNIININLKPSSAGYIAALRRGNGISGIAPQNFLQTSNGNIYFAPNVANSWLYAEGMAAGTLVNTYNFSNDPAFNTPCSAFKTFLGHDKNSFTEDNLVVAAVQGAFAPTGLSFAKEGAVPTMAPQNAADIANVARPSLFDIGALQFSGTVIDSAGPTITVSPVPNISYCATCNFTIVATISDVSGVDTSTTRRPRLYYKKSTDANTFAGNTSSNNGWKYVTPLSISRDTFTFNADCSLLRSATTFGDSISYFIIAQDLSSNPHVAATDASFTSCPSSVALGSANAPVLNWPVSNGFKILPTPAFSLSAFPAAVCQSGFTTLSINPKPIGATVQWQSAAPGGAFTAITGATADTFYTGIITTSRWYRALIYCGTSVLDTTDVDTFIVAHPSLSAVKGDTLCGYGKAVLTATASAFSNPKWYASASGGRSIFVGDSFSTPNISSTTTYFVTASTPKASTYSLGLLDAPASTNTMYNYGLEIILHNSRNYFYSTTVYAKGSGTFSVELIDMNTGNPAKDIFGAPIPQRQFHVSGPGGIATPNILNLNWRDILPGHYSLNVVTGSYTAGLYLSYNYTYPNQPYPISTPTSCVDIVGPTNNSSVYPYPNYYYFFYDNVVSCDCDSSARIPVTAVVTAAPAITVSNPAYPGICFGQSTYLSVSSPNSSYNYTWTPGAITTSGFTVSPSFSTIYHVTAHDASTGCTAIDSAIVNVNSVPTVPTITPKNPTVCGGSLIALNGSTSFGANINWLNVSRLFKDSLLATAISIADTNSKVFAAPIVTTAYTAVANAQGCLSLPSVPDTVFVNPGPNASITASGSDTICSGSSVSYCTNYSPNLIFQWYLNNTAIIGAHTHCFTASLAGNYSVVVTDILTGCSARSISHTVTVLAAPSIAITSGNSVNFCKGGTDTLLATGGGIASYQWVMNGVIINGTTSQKYVASSNGNYTCIATNAVGCTDTSNSILVTASAPNVMVNPQGSLSVCNGGTVTLQAAISPGLTYIWYHAGSPIPGQTFFAYTATNSGNYYVKITDTTTSCSDTSKHFNVVVGAPPLTKITPASSTVFCVGDSVVLHAVAAPGLTYQWRKGGVNITNGNDSIYVAKTSGNYTVLVNIAATPACKDSTTTATVVTVNALPTASITASGTNTFCGGDSLVLNTTAATGIAYQWNLNNAALSAADTGLHYIARSSGSYTLTATNKATGCAATSNNITATVRPAPPILILPISSNHFCQGDSVTLQSNLSANYHLVWNKNGAPIMPLDSSISYVAYSSGLYSVTAKDSLTGCTATSAATMLTLDSLPAAATIPTGTSAICQNTPITLHSATKDTSVNYQWRLNGSNIIGARADSIQTNLPGSYVLVLTGKGNACVDSSATLTLNVTVPPLASITAPTKTRVCAGDTVKLVANTGTGLSYQWRYFGNAIPAATATTYSAFLPGIYTVSVSNGPLCTSLSQAVSVKVDSLPAAFISYSSGLDFCAGDSVILVANSGPAYTYSWKMNSWFTGDTSIQFVARTSAAFSVEVTDSMGCSNISDSVTVIEHQLPIPSIVRSGNALQTSLPYLSYQWYLNAAAISGANNRTYTMSAVGVYSVSVVDSFGCEGLSFPFQVATLGIDNAAIAKSINVYPNPTTDILNVEAAVTLKVALRDAMGRTILEASDVKKIDLGDVANGAYLLFISDKEGHLLKVEKVVKRTNH